MHIAKPKLRQDRSPASLSSTPPTYLPGRTRLDSCHPDRRFPEPATSNRSVSIALLFNAWIPFHFLNGVDVQRESDVYRRIPPESIHENIEYRMRQRREL